MFDHLQNKKIILASKSPRRQELLKGLGIPFTILTREVEEDFPLYLKDYDVARFLAEKKAMSFTDVIDDNTIVITCDTIVCINEQVLNKPSDRDDAVRMLRLLSGKMHQVHTGVCLYSHQHRVVFHETTNVYFKELSQNEIDHYIDNCKPFDKAGSYGVQEWMGYVGMRRIEGCFFNVMGLPLHALYTHLQKWI